MSCDPHDPSRPKTNQDNQAESPLTLALADCLDRIEREGNSRDDCLARYPHLAAELRPLLSTAQTLRAVPPVAPSATFRAVARQRLLNQLGRQQPVTQKMPRPSIPTVLFPWLRTLAPRLVAALLILVILTTGSAWAAEQSLPDSPFYPIKLAAEQVRIGLTPNLVRKANTLMELADRRLAEALIMAARNRPLAARRALLAYDDLLNQLTAALNRAAAEKQDVAPLVRRIENSVFKQQVALRQASLIAPEALRPIFQTIEELTYPAQQRLLNAARRPRDTGDRERGAGNR